MFRSLVFATLVIFLSAPLATGADRDTEQLRAEFDDGYFNQFKTNNPEGFARVDALMAGMGEYINEILGEQIQTVRDTTNEFKARPLQVKLKALMACSDLPPNFDKIKSKTTITSQAALTYRLAFAKCRMAQGLLAPYLNKHPTAMIEWQRVGNLVPVPKGTNTKDASIAYDAEIESRFEGALANGVSPGAAAQTTDITPEPAGDQPTYNARPAGAPQLPVAPFRFNWDEIAMIRSHTTWALDTYDAEKRRRYGLKQCTAMLDAPKGAYAAHTTINSWATQCGKQISLGLDSDYGQNLQEFGRYYQAEFIEFEKNMQKANVSRLTVLPAEPYLFQPAEIQRFRDYMRIASNSSLLLLAGLESTGGLASLNPGDVCRNTDPSLLKTDLSNPFVRDNWTGYVNRLTGCAKNIQRVYPLAGNPLMASLEAYRAALQAKPVKSLFN
ncbi:MAG: hypothetical protein RIA65_14745 [Woeseia sp.]